MIPSSLSTRSSLLIAVCAGAFLLRVGAAITLSPHLLSDDLEYVELARSLTEDGSYALNDVLTAYRPPGYPFFLANIFTVAGESLPLVRILQALLDTLTCLLVYRLASRYVSNRWALGAAVVYACFPLQILYVSSIMSETLFTFLFTLSLVMATEDDAGWKEYIMAGIVAGLAALVRPTGLIAPVVLLFIPAFLQLDVSVRMKQAGIFLAGMLLVVSPWLVRNEMEFGRPAMASHTGVNFWIGNHEGANGSFTYPEGNPLSMIDDEFERSDEGFRLGMDYLASHPAEGLILAGRKFAFLFGIDYWILMSHTWEPEWQHASGMREIVRNFPAGSVLLTHIPIIMITLLSLWAFAAAPPEERSRWLFMIVLITGWIIVHLMFFGSARLRFPIHPFLIVAAVYGSSLLISRTYPNTVLRWTIFGVITLLLSAGWIAEGWTIIAD